MKNPAHLTDGMRSDVEEIYEGLLGPGSARDDEGRGRSGCTLYAVFCNLWSFHLGRPQQDAICGRILAFHLMMERTSGKAIEGWYVPIDETEAQVHLHPAVVDAIGSTRLYLSKGFSEQEFGTSVLIHAGNSLT